METNFTTFRDYVATTSGNFGLGLDHYEIERVADAINHDLGIGFVRCDPEWDRKFLDAASRELRPYCERARQDAIARVAAIKAGDATEGQIAREIAAVNARDGLGMTRDEIAHHAKLTHRWQGWGAVGLNLHSFYLRRDAECEDG